MSDPTRESTHGGLDLDDLEPTEQLPPVESPEQAAPSEKSGAGLTLGLGLVGLGFVAVGFAWSKVAALTNVAQQVPYVMSGGLSGLMLIIIGVVIVDITVRRRDSQERRSQLANLTHALAELRERLQPEEEEDR